MRSLRARASAPADRRAAAARRSRAVCVALATTLLAACSSGTLVGSAGTAESSSGAGSSSGGSSSGTSGGSSGAAGVVVTVSPGSISLSAGSSYRFVCAVTGTADGGCSWSVLEGAPGGAVTGEGAYTAPATAGTYHVVATSRGARDRAASATVLVTEGPPPHGVSVLISPPTASLAPGASVQLSASVAGTADAVVSWTIQEGAAGGTVDGAGLYTAPAGAGTYHVLATSHADASTHGSATVMVRAPDECTDACPAPGGGVAWDCRKRFMYGLNWAWGEWGADFGGIAAWGKAGVKAASASFDARMKSMKAAGVNVIRWWMFPRFLTESITWGPDGAPSGIGGTLLADVEEALRLAEVNDVYVMLTPFSFDNFRPTTSESGLPSPGLRPIVQSASLRRNLIENLVKPVARAVEASPHRKRMLAWDLINEPEWAVSGPSLHGDPAFEPTSRIEPVSHAEMETFLQELAAAIRSNSSALITVGGAAIKWPKAWSRVDVDFYQFHYYDWVYEWFPYTTVTPASVGVTDRPVVVGEFPAAGLSAVKGQPARTAAEFSSDLWDLGYAGALAWAFNDPAFPWSPAAIRAFPDRHACETAY